MKLVFLLIALTPALIQGLDNGLARKPPMGWMSWTRFACNTDCQRYPDECIHERLYREMADVMDKDGYREAGYEFVSVDDCWSEKTRDPKTEKLVAHGERFPSGMKALGDFIHSKNLKYGLYSDMGYETCQNYPGHVAYNGSNYFDIDAESFAEWGVDYLKVDGCNINTTFFDTGYPALSRAITKVGRPMVLSCEWPFYQGVYDHIDPDYPAITKWCHQYRNFYDVADSWASVLSIIDFYAKNNDKFAQYHGPGHWNDPDMLTIGNFGLSLEQSKAQMAMWAMMAAPLFMSNDLRKITPQEKAILLNKKVIAVDQDEAGHLAKMVHEANNIQVWVKKLNTTDNFAVAYLNKNTLGAGEFVSHPVDKILGSFAVDQKEFTVEDLFNEDLSDTYVNMNRNLTLKVVPSGVRMVKLSPK